MRRLEEVCCQLDFWDKPHLAKLTLSELKCVRKQLDTLNALEVGITELSSLAETELEAALTEAEEQAAMNGPLDRRNAIICLQARNRPGACAEVERLRRLYRQEAAKRGYRVQVLTVSEHEEGLSFAAFSILRAYCFGWAKKHCLLHEDVQVEVLPEIHLGEVLLNEKDVAVSLFRQSNLNGRGVKVTGCSIQMVHLPTGIKVRCNTERSEAIIRRIGLQILLAKLYMLQFRLR